VTQNRGRERKCYPLRFRGKKNPLLEKVTEKRRNLFLLRSKGKKAILCMGEEGPFHGEEQGL